MSMYAVNVSIPKTLVRYLTAYEAQHSEGILKTVLLDVLDTPVSPELLPPDKNGEIAQKTEDVVGPYELHDFFLYYLVRFGFEPNKIYYLAKKHLQENTIMPQSKSGSQPLSEDSLLSSSSVHVCLTDRRLVL